MLRFTTATRSHLNARYFSNLTIFGSGLMGAGIAQVAAQSNVNVTVVDLNQEALNKGSAIISSSLKRVAKKKFQDNVPEQEKFVNNVMKNVKFETNLNSACQNADLIIEAVSENLNLKHKLFIAIDKVAPKHTVLASNTSSLKIKEIAQHCPSRFSNFAGLHFFNPVPQMKLVEIIRIPETDEKVTQALVEFCKKLGKVPVLCKDTPGFIVNRLLVPYMMEAIRLVERGDATKEDVDTAMKLGAGYPMGPFELLDVSLLKATFKYMLK
ncbi:hypothetical protein HK099_001726 [Clydaea vesicula]|uniref:3-hydroxyacyl-CoA dehydrogenase n=1 Tax=Clydaea vesicula TaxID=447962 RepID=A0AAD5TTU8_9FUNG|nr:hypothetical protein HK099_001726 [Clydaea vesicula]